MEGRPQLLPKNPRLSLVIFQQKDGMGQAQGSGTEWGGGDRKPPQVRTAAVWSALSP